MGVFHVLPSVGKMRLRDGIIKIHQVIGFSDRQGQGIGILAELGIDGILHQATHLAGG